MIGAGQSAKASRPAVAAGDPLGGRNDGGMTQERYPGERQGLGLFLEELRPIAAGTLGTDSLLHHAIKKALATGRLETLRHARALFNSLPREQRQTLQAGMLANMEPAADDRPAADEDGPPRPFAPIGIEAAVGTDKSKGGVENG